MRDYKSPWNRNQLDDLAMRDSNPIATLAALVVISCIIVALVVSCADSIDKTLSIQSQHYGQPDTLRPQAYRKASPTHEQMWALDSLMKVSEVAHGNR